MTNSLNGAGYSEYEDVNLPEDENEKTEEELLAECEEADFSGASDEIGFANDR